MESVAEKRMEEPRLSGDWSFEEVEEFDALAIDFKPKPKEKYPAKLHARSVAKRLGVKDGLIYLPGLPYLNYEDSDQPVIFRQRRYFFYLSGINFPGCVITYNIHCDRLYAWIPPPSRGSAVIYNGQVPSRQQVMSDYDFDEVGKVTNIDNYLTYFAHNEPGKIYLLHNYEHPKAIPKHVTYNDRTTTTISASPFESTLLKPAMDAARAIKSAFELKLIRKASAITAQAHINVLRGIKQCENEAEIEAIFAATCISEQAKHQAYGVIAASGPNASTLHYIANNESLKDRQLLCLDAGCEWKCYASDVTRTFPISGEFTPEAKAVYDIVAQMQEECISMVKPGANYRAIHMHAHRIAVQGLMKLGLLQNGTFEELYLSGASAAFFPHGLGHYLGLECHDVGENGYLLYGFIEKPKDWSAALLDMIKSPFTTPASILQPNMVITVEPGIYFSRYALEEVYLKSPRYAKFINKELLETYYPIGGVRIEDDILVTEDGYENLTTAPKGDDALKIIKEGTENFNEEKRKRGWLW